jgi:hypothetical protein
VRACGTWRLHSSRVTSSPVPASEHVNPANSGLHCSVTLRMNRRRSCDNPDRCPTYRPYLRATTRSHIAVIRALGHAPTEISQASNRSPCADTAPARRRCAAGAYRSNGPTASEIAAHITASACKTDLDTSRHHAWMHLHRDRFRDWSALPSSPTLLLKDFHDAMTDAVVANVGRCPGSAWFPRRRRPRRASCQCKYWRFAVADLERPWAFGRF